MPIDAGGLQSNRLKNRSIFVFTRLDERRRYGIVLPRLADASTRRIRIERKFRTAQKSAHAVIRCRQSGRPRESSLKVARPGKLAGFLLAQKERPPRGERCGGRAT